MNASNLFPKAIENKVAYVASLVFHCNEKGQNTMRISFSFPSEQQIVEGIQRLAKMLRENI
jgi:2-aminoadipate transaminase